MDKQTGAEVEDDADDDIGKKPDGRLYGGELLDLLETASCQTLSSVGDGLVGSMRDIQQTEEIFHPIQHRP